MKLSATATLLGTAIAAFPGVSASTVSLRGILPEKEKEASFFAHCFSKRGSCNTYGENSCQRIQDDCGVCAWNGNTCHETGPVWPPTPQPTDSNRSWDCRVGQGQCGDSQWCQTLGYGMCSAGSQGTCTYYTGGCENHSGPKVCGCDGKTYSNECWAQAASVNIDYVGSCDSFNNRCQVNMDQCGSGQWCQTSSQGMCATGSQGTCVYYMGDTSSCEQDNGAPVCGCDGNDYQNECFATAAGVNVGYYGSCPPKCQVNKNQCPSGQWCQTSSQGMCSTGSQGNCMYYTGYNGSCNQYGNLPVCGCDWNTYQNACFAHAASVNILYNGSCNNEEEEEETVESF